MQIFCGQPFRRLIWGYCCFFSHGILPGDTLLWCTEHDSKGGPTAVGGLNLDYPPNTVIIDRLLNGIYSLSDRPALSPFSAYAAPPLNARRIPWSLRSVSVEFALSLRYKSGVERRRCCMYSTTLLFFSPFRLFARFLEQH